MWRAPCVIIIDVPIQIQKEAAKSTLEQKWKHHSVREIKIMVEGGGAVAGSEGVGGGGWRCTDVWVGVWDDGSGLRSEGGSEGWAGITKVIFPGWYTTTRTTEIREETHQGHPALPLPSMEAGGAEEAIITTLHAFQNKSVKSKGRRGWKYSLASVRSLAKRKMNITPRPFIIILVL